MSLWSPVRVPAVFPLRRPWETWTCHPPSTTYLWLQSWAFHGLVSTDFSHQPLWIPDSGLFLPIPGIIRLLPPLWRCFRHPLFKVLIGGTSVWHFCESYIAVEVVMFFKQGTLRVKKKGEISKTYLSRMDLCSEYQSHISPAFSMTPVGQLTTSFNFTSTELNQPPPPSPAFSKFPVSEIGSSRCLKKN